MHKYISTFFILLLVTADLAFAEGVMTPEKILPAGVDVTESVNPYTGEKAEARKGTVAATLSNIVTLNKLLEETVSVQTNQKIDEVSQAIIKLLPSLRVIGMFDLFTIQEWLQNHQKQPGRTLVALFYLQKYPKEVSSDIKTQLNQINNETTIHAIKIEIKKLI